MGFPVPRLGQDDRHHIGLFQLQFDADFAQLDRHRFHQGDEFRRPGEGVQPGLGFEAVRVAGLCQ